MLAKKDDNQELIPQEELIGDRYQVIEALGKGGMGVVVKARHVGLGKLVAIKVLNAAMLVDEISRKRFEVEAKAAGNLSHPNLISVFDYGFTAQGEPFIVMEYIEGDSLDRYIEKHGSMKFEDFVDIFVQICRALQYVHNNNIVHRDLKPGNVMVHLIGDERYVKVLDFGIAKVFSDDGQPAQHLTATGAAFGSPLYMSPEQCQGQKIDARADIYSFGCVMYECISGEPPIVGDNALHTIFKQVSDLPAMLPSANQKEHQLALVVDKCLQKKREDRYQNVGELLAAFARLRLDANNPAESKEQARSETSRQAGGLAARWTTHTDDPTTFTPTPEQIGFQPGSPTGGDGASDARTPRPRMTHADKEPPPARPRMSRPDIEPPPSGIFVPSQTVAPPAGKQPSLLDRSYSIAVTGGKVLFVLAGLGILLGLAHSFQQSMMIETQYNNLKNGFPKGNMLRTVAPQSSTLNNGIQNPNTFTRVGPAEIGRLKFENEQRNIETLKVWNQLNKHP